MSQEIDNQIAAVEKQLQQLRREKLGALQAEIAALEASLGPAATAADTSGGRGGMNEGSSARGGAAGRRRRRGGKSRHLTDDAAITALTKVIRGAGKDGIAGKQASVATGVSYPRAMQLLSANFKRAGYGKWTRFRMK